MKTLLTIEVFAADLIRTRNALAAHAHHFADYGVHSISPASVDRSIRTGELL
jgi:hypothetical protein